MAKHAEYDGSLIIRPVAYDQFDNASRAMRLGVAKEVLPKKYNGRVVADVLKTFLSDESIRLRCQEVALRLAHCNATSVACDSILASLGKMMPNRTAQRIVVSGD